MSHRVVLALRSRPARRRAVRAVASLALLGALLVASVPTHAAAAGPLMAPLGSNLELSNDGRVLADIPDGVTLATVRGASLVNPAIPVTAETRRAGSRWAPPAGTKFRILATAYSSTRDQTDSTPFITASGTRVHDGTVAVNFLPFGTKVRFTNYRPGMVFTVEDRHSPRLTSRVDIWFSSRAAALDFGARVLRMEVVE